MKNMLLNFYHKDRRTDPCKCLYQRFEDQAENRFNIYQATSDRQIRLGLAECLGELGAIDPGKLDLHNDEYSSKGKILHDLPKNVYDVRETDVQVRRSSIVLVRNKTCTCFETDSYTRLNSQY